MTSLNVVNDRSNVNTIVLTYDAKTKMLGAIFKNAPCFCKFDMYAIAKTVQIAHIHSSRVYKSI